MYYSFANTKSCTEPNKVGIFKYLVYVYINTLDTKQVYVKDHQTIQKPIHKFSVGFGVLHFKPNGLEKNKITG